MTWQADLAPLTYFPCPVSDRLLAVGWLSARHAFTTGATQREVYDRLVELSTDPWQPFVSMGFHECDLCQFSGEARATANLFIPVGDVLYVAPAMIAHYVNAHHYRPPEVFCAAVIACPPMRTQAYRAAIAACAGARGLLRQGAQ